ncbi:uncharacterized protein LOC125855898 [Solanum stenotomum]|uniref:uncharacterized protein LOC125855898 n=1 Tax=Solanum stenotomum TaxID=172797 RepID=UPI0020D089A7|nr:uncharacterized protein LOC125855898 [Solanum stenotomum]
MIKTLCWNARSINTLGSLERLQTLKKLHNLSMIAILEPFADNSHLNSYRIKLNMENACCNSNGKIWLFWTAEINLNILESEDQHITGTMLHVEIKDKFLITIVYAKSCGLMDLGYTSQRYTWCNQRNEEARVWKRLDRAMVNDNWLQGIPQTVITHLPSVGSDHCPLLMEIVDKVKQPIKYFKFLHCWTEHEEFNNVVKACWDRDVEGNPMWRLQQKIKRLTVTPSNWSRTTFGDIFSIVRHHEERVRVVEEALIVNNSAENRADLHRINARYIKYLKLEDFILKQKTQLQWFKDGDTNSKYFHAIMRGRRRKLFIHRSV